MRIFFSALFITDGNGAERIGSSISAGEATGKKKPKIVFLALRAFLDTIWLLRLVGEQRDSRL